jgi:hypothetical protein
VINFAVYKPDIPINKIPQSASSLITHFTSCNREHLSTSKTKNMQQMAHVSLAIQEFS